MFLVNFLFFGEKFTQNPCKIHYNIHAKLTHAGRQKSRKLVAQSARIHHKIHANSTQIPHKFHTQIPLVPGENLTQVPRAMPRQVPPNNVGGGGREGGK